MGGGGVIRSHARVEGVDCKVKYRPMNLETREHLRSVVAYCFQFHRLSNSERFDRNVDLPLAHSSSHTDTHADSVATATGNQPLHAEGYRTSIRKRFDGNCVIKVLDQLGGVPCYRSCERRPIRAKKLKGLWGVNLSRGKNKGGTGQFIGNCRSGSRGIIGREGKIRQIDGRRE